RAGSRRSTGQPGRPGRGGTALSLPDKRKILQRLCERLAERVDQMRASQLETRAGATHPETRQEHPKDTRAIEAGYLARGLAGRVETLQEDLVALQRMELRDFGPGAPVALGALIEVERAGGGRAVYFLLPVAGGEAVEVDGGEVLVVTPASPIGEAMMGAVCGDELEVRGPRATVVGVG
ncbi:hypothetical protein KGQ64_13660, partial [bacterium]|nr:hypothetical protein [bacterium]